jgi:hypothetical protein
VANREMRRLRRRAASSALEQIDEQINKASSAT